MYSVYALVDPRDQAIRYVGMSKNVWRRYAMHLLIPAKRAASKNAWVAELREVDLSPLLEILETSETIEAAAKRETYWIQHYLSKGANLLNVSKTGIPPHVEGSSDVAVIARGLKMSEGTILGLIQREELPARKVGKEWVIEQKDLDHWLTGQSNFNTEQS